MPVDDIAADTLGSSVTPCRSFRCRTSAAWRTAPPSCPASPPAACPAKGQHHRHLQQHAEGVADIVGDGIPQSFRRNRRPATGSRGLQLPPPAPPSGCAPHRRTPAGATEPAWLRRAPGRRHRHRRAGAGLRAPSSFRGSSLSSPRASQSGLVERGAIAPGVGESQGFAWENCPDGSGRAARAWDGVPILRSHQPA